MKKCSCFALLFCAIVGSALSELEARPGARGGARLRGTFDRSPNLGRGSKPRSGPNLNGPSKLGNGQFGKPDAGELGSGPLGQKPPSAESSSRVGAARNKFSQLQANFSSKNEPFSPAWYADHPDAWHYTHPHADAWAVATLGAAVAWLGAEAVYPGGGDVTNVYTADGLVQQDEQVADEGVAGAKETGADLAARGAVDVPNDTQFLSLGVYALAPVEHKQATALVQLSVTHDGVLRGSYVDLLSDQGQTVVGAVDKVSQRVAWTLGEHGPVVFETTLETLAQPEGPVSLQFADGRAHQYTLARYQSPTSETQ